MSTLTLLIIRHAEKPGEQWLGPGPHRERPAGWQVARDRAAGNAPERWAALFGSDLGGNDSQILAPSSRLTQAPGARRTRAPKACGRRRPSRRWRRAHSPRTRLCAGPGGRTRHNGHRAAGPALISWEHRRSLRSSRGSGAGRRRPPWPGDVTTPSGFRPGFRREVQIRAAAELLLPGDSNAY